MLFISADSMYFKYYKCPDCGKEWSESSSRQGGSRSSRIKKRCSSCSSSSGPTTCDKCGGIITMGTCPNGHGPGRMN